VLNVNNYVCNFIIIRLTYLGNKCTQKGTITKQMQCDEWRAAR